MKRPKGSGQPSRGGSGRRQETVRVKTARQRSLSSTLWLQRQLNDPYVSEAKGSGYRSRAAFKLKQLDDRFGFIGRDKSVVDLGSAPGGWLQVAVERGAKNVIGLDYLDIEPVPGATALKLDFLSPEAPGELKALMCGPADLVLSDMAAPTTGHGQTDHLRVMALAEAAYEFAHEVLAQGGSFVAKVFQGGTERALLDRLKRDFTSVRHVKPHASRADSAEIYVVAIGFRAAADRPDTTET